MYCPVAAQRWRHLPGPPSVVSLKPDDSRIADYFMGAVINNNNRGIFIFRNRCERI